MKQIFRYMYQTGIVAFTVAMLLTGCTQEATRKADWETHFTDIHFANSTYGWIVGEKGH